jgi:hypothetical protein
VEGEVGAFDEVMKGQGDFYALVAARRTTSIFEKARCSYLKAMNKPNFNISVDDLAAVSTNAFSMGNKFITQIWAKGGREIEGDEARALLDEVCFKPFFNDTSCSVLIHLYLSVG